MWSMKTGDENATDHFNMCLLFVNAVFYEESFGKNRALYFHLTYKDVDHFWNGLVHGSHCLKA